MAPEFLGNAHGVVISESQLNGVQGNQTIIHNHYYNYHPDSDQIPVTADQPSDQLATPQSAIPSPKDSIQRRSVVLTNLSHAVGVPDEIHRLITDIVWLIDHDKTCTYEALKLELELLEQTLAATGLGIQVFRCTPIGRRLVETIKPILAQCINILQHLFDTVDTYRQNLSLTSIRYLWHLVWHWGCEVDQLTSWRKRLFDCQRLLGTVVMALHSWVSLAPGPVPRYPLKCDVLKFI